MKMSKHFLGNYLMCLVCRFNDNKYNRSPFNSNDAIIIIKQIPFQFF